MRFYRIFILLTFISFSFSPLLAFSKTNLTELTTNDDSSFITDSLNEIKYKRHVTSLFYIARKNDNSKYFLNLANSYVDSIFQINSNDEFAHEFKTKISLILSTCEENLNHKYSLFTYFKKIPEYFGFVDEPLEYAYDKSIDKLLSARPVAFVLEEGNITKSILIKENCNDEIFEIINQKLIKNVNHSIVPFYKLENYLGKNDASNLVNGNLDKKYISKLCNKLKIQRIGIFKVNDVDVIDNSVFLVNTSFCTYTNEEGFSDTLSKKAFTIDKRFVSLLEIIKNILFALLLISFISFLDQRKKILKILNDKNSLIISSFFKLFINKILFVINCFPISFVFSFVMIYAISNFCPEPAEHFLEFSSVFWLFSLTIVMSIIPTLLNLLFVNRLELDGFHSQKGYRYFFNTSLFASYFPVFVFYYIQYNKMLFFESLLLISITFIISDLLSRSYYLYTSKSIHKNLKSLSLFGLILGTMSLVFCNFCLLSELNIQNLFYALFIAVPFNLIHYVVSKKIGFLNSKKLSESVETSVIKDVFVTSVLDPNSLIFDRIVSTKTDLNISDDNLNILIFSAPMGIGKTTVLKNVETSFRDSGWNWYYGDCDEIQGENSVSFEPFLEAFSELLQLKEFSDRGKDIESKKSTIQSAISLTGISTDFITDFERNEDKPMTEICIDIIDKLEDLDKKTVFVLEDLHWIDPESYSFLKHFIQIVNNNEFLRGNLCIILTMRNGSNDSFRGVSYENLVPDLEILNVSSVDKFIVEDLINISDFKLHDFVKNLSDQNNKFKIQTSSMYEINNVFNQREKRNLDSDILTPLYILKVIESWIDSSILKYSPDGYFLTQNISVDDLPNTSEVDSYYHSIFDLFEPKWQRLLESAAIIGIKFDADILARVWGYELLDILAFLEKAVKYDLLKDLSDEDNLYEFTDKRIITAIKSYFSINDDEQSQKQIVIEYNKRYITLQKDIINNPNLYSIEDVLKVARRLVLLKSSQEYKNQLHDLILVICIRFIESNDFDKLSAFSSFLKSMKMNRVSFIIDVLTNVSNPNNDNEITEENIQKIYPLKENKKQVNFSVESKFEKELVLISCIYYDPDIINEDDLIILESYLSKKYKQNVLFYLSYYLFDSIIKSRSEKFKKYDNLLLSLKESKDYELYHNIISVAKLIEKRDFLSTGVNDTWSNVYPKPSVNDLKTEYLDIYKRLIDFNNLSVLYTLTKSYIGFLSNQLRKRDDAIEFYLKTISIFEANDNFLHETVELKMYIVTILCRKKFIKKHPEIAKSDFDFVESYVNKRYNKKSYNHFLYRFYRYKMLYFQEIKDFLLMRDVSLFHLKLMKKKIGENKFGYAHGCGHYATALSYLGEGKKAIKWYEKKISILKSLFKKSEYQMLRIPHSNLVHDYMEFDPKNHKKILLHAKYALEYAIDTDVDHYIALKTYAKALYHTGDFKESHKYYKKSFESLSSVDIDDKDEYLSDLTLDIAIVYSEIDIKNAIPMIKDALNNAYDPKLLYWKQVDKAKSILKENNEL